MHCWFIVNTRQIYCKHINIFCTLTKIYCANTNIYCTNKNIYCLVINIYCTDVNIYCLLYQNTCNHRSKIVLSIRTINLGFMLLDSTKDEMFAQILVFSYILVFLGLHWPKNEPKFKTLGTSRFSQNSRFLKDSSKAVFVFMKSTSGENFSKIEPYLAD